MERQLLFRDLHNRLKSLTIDGVAAVEAKTRGFNSWPSMKSLSTVYKGWKLLYLPASMIPSKKHEGCCKPSIDFMQSQLFIRGLHNWLKIGDTLAFFCFFQPSFKKAKGLRIFYSTQKYIKSRISMYQIYGWWMHRFSRNGCSNIFYAKYILFCYGVVCSHSHQADWIQQLQLLTLNIFILFEQQHSHFTSFSTWFNPLIGIWWYVNQMDIN